MGMLFVIVTSASALIGALVGGGVGSRRDRVGAGIAWGIIGGGLGGIVGIAVVFAMEKCVVMDFTTDMSASLLILIACPVIVSALSAAVFVRDGSHENR